jgi:hypothetical protein
MTDPSQSIAELDGLIVERGAYGTGRTAWLARALVSPLQQLGPAEWRLLLQHGHGLRWVLPPVTARLTQEPFTSIDGEPAALLLAALVVPIERWVEHSTSLAAMRTLLIAALESTTILPPTARQRVEEDGALFLELTRGLN